jgi:L-amino acid N-acyltransferase YncA
MVSIRMADPSVDAAACAAVYANYVRSSHVTFETEPPTADELDGRIRTTLAWTPWLVACENNAVLGYAYASRHRERAGYRWAVDTSIYLDRAAHGHGIGRALYAELFPLLVRQGFYRAYAGIGLPNAPSVGIHRSFGFEDVGVYRKIGWKQGAWIDVLWMARDLRNDDLSPPAEPIPLPELAAGAPNGITSNERCANVRDLV